MKETDPKSTSRALAFELWMKAPMPMVTLIKTLDVTPLVRLSRKRGYKFNMLLCWCIGKAAAGMEDFYLLPVGDKLMRYDRLAVNTVVRTRDGGIATCDIPVEQLQGLLVGAALRVGVACAPHRQEVHGGHGDDARRPGRQIKFLVLLLVVKGHGHFLRFLGCS